MTKNASTEKTPKDDPSLQREWRDLHWEISRLKKAARVAREKQIVAEARSHDNKHRAKAAENGLRGLQQRVERAEEMLSAIVTGVPDPQFYAAQWWGGYQHFDAWKRKKAKAA